MLKGAQIARIGLDCEVSRQQVVTRITGAHSDDVARPSQVGQILVKNNLYVHSRLIGPGFTGNSPDYAPPDCAVSAGGNRSTDRKCRQRIPAPPAPAGQL